MFGGPRPPVFALVGVTLASAMDGIVTHRDKLETVCENIRICMEATLDHERENDDSRKFEILLKDLQLGSVIAKGCNAVVHAARWKITVPKERPDFDDSLSDSSIEVLTTDDNDHSEFREIGFEPRTAYPNPTSFNKLPPNVQDICRPFNGYDLAVKMMFNYEAESNASAILCAMNKEIVPAKSIAAANEETELFANNKRKIQLPPHPNIVDMQCLFADNVPDLPDAMSLYPDALPKRLNRNGAGRNMTLFLVMKRYHCNLQQYLHAYQPSPRTSLLIMAQLMEGVVHLGRNLVAHRDLKTDNILLDLSEGVDYPHLVIADFGCCLADEALGLKLPYYTEETDRGGNSALMAPEVACITPGQYVIIDYGKADLWAVGALAYEIFGQKNPFYRTEKGVPPRLDSRNYRESDLPDLPNNVHPIAKRLIFDILKRNQIKRPTCKTAANVFDILLFGPKKLVSLLNCRMKDGDIVQWILTLTARTVIQRSVPQNRRKFKRIEQQLLTSFLHRVNLDQLSEAIEYFDLK